MKNDALLCGECTSHWAKLTYQHSPCVWKYGSKHEEPLYEARKSISSVRKSANANQTPDIFLCEVTWRRMNHRRFNKLKFITQTKWRSVFCVRRPHRWINASNVVSLGQFTELVVHPSSFCFSNNLKKYCEIRVIAVLVLHTHWKRANCFCTYKH